jgi:sugar phosphate isomerase/epimerase
MKRRIFLTNTALATAGAAVLSNFSCASKTMSTTGGASTKEVGLQLYSLRDVINTDVKGIVKNLADWGYKKFETYGYNNGQLFGMPSKEFASYCKGLGVQVMSGHYGIDVVRGNWEQAVADAKEAGQEFMVLPWIAPADRTEDGYKKIIADVNKAAEVTKKYGIRMGYHNHDFEFQQVGNQTGWDLLLKELDPKLVSIEMDIYWVVRAGHDPVKYFEQYPGRFDQWHVKDMSKTDPTQNADVGTGSIDFKSLFTKAKAAGLRHYYVEQETYPADPLSSAKNSVDYMKTI